MKTFTRKGYGRIYVEKPEDIEAVSQVIKELDEDEFDYMPTDLITVFTDYPRVVYVGKFCDLDMIKLTAACWEKGIRMWVFDNGDDE